MSDQPDQQTEQSDERTGGRTDGQTAPLVVLVGPPGSGKSTVGRLLADRLGVPLRDTDDDIVASVGKPISDIFIDDGEPAFREQERAAVAAALAEHHGVLALGGGAVTSDAVRAALRGHTVVYLSVNLHNAAERVGLARDRPVLTLNPRATLRHLLAQRAPLYEDVATFTVDTSDREPAAVADELADTLAEAVRR